MYTVVQYISKQYRGYKLGNTLVGNIVANFWACNSVSI